MGELKSCLFCGKNVDQAFEYCPHCGYEFGQGEDRSSLGSDSAFGGELPGLVEETSGECARQARRTTCIRLRTLQEIPPDMERELDLIIRTSSKDP